jgi:acetyl-CoA decarbonylase/synthase complex subunit gamma
MVMETDKTESPCCCGQTPLALGPLPAEAPLPSAGPRYDPSLWWMTGAMPSAAGEVPRVSTSLTWRDRLGAWKVRWGIGRSRHRITCGLYAAGSPDAGSPVLVTANYKLSFDRLRAQLAGRDAWILVLDTKGVNVWCSAGKGTFGTEELIRRAELARLREVVSHHRLILPQLSATGVSAHKVRERSGWRVVYGPVRTEDLPAFLDAGLKASGPMRRVGFSLRARLAVAPVDLVHWGKYVLVAAACLLLLSGLSSRGYDLRLMAEDGLRSAFFLLLTLVMGTVLFPALLPWIPGRAFAGKGALLGLLGLLLWALGVAGDGGGSWLGLAVADSRLEMAAWLLLVPALTSFLAMNFTGSTTFTSLSGVRKEMKVAVPLQAAAAGAAVVLWLAGRFV